MSVPAYPEYKDSGVPWLGNIPNDWSVERFRRVFRESPEKIDTDVIGPMLSVSGYRGIEIKGYDDENRRRLDEDLIGYRIVRPGQLVVNTMWLNYAGLGVSEHEGHVSPAYRSYWIERDVDRRYVHHLMRSSIYVQGYTQLLTGIRPNSLQMSRDDLMDFPVLVPPRTHQTAIATFLDRETAKIDALVAEQERLIALLKEKRQAVISRAVTKGLNPNAPMKDSGIEWLGEIPAHWEVVPLKYFGKFNAGAGFPHEEQGSEGNELTFYKVNALGKANADDVLIDSDDTISRETAGRLRAVIFPPDTIAFAKIGAALLLGRLRITARESCFDNNLMGLTVNDANEPQFVKASMNLVRFDYISNPGTVPSLNESQIANVSIARPPLEEQCEIASFLARQIRSFEELGAEAQSAITLLQERRAALISAAVTGKIDVRGLVEAPLERELA